MAGDGFSLGISPEQKLAMPLDDLIKKAKKNTPKRLAGAKAAKPMNNPKRKQQSVKKTVTVPVAKNVRAKVMQVVSSNKRQAVMNKRRPGLVVAPQSGKRAANGVAVQLRRRKTTALDAARSMAKQQQQKPRRTSNFVGNSSGIDVSGIERHFRTHPTKFNLPKGTNLRITINTNKIKPVVGAKKK
ncbi:hypothetical protein ATCC90586_005573 [Pythium insidiosum]|nr:hypothetical protein ATCC90586_005573 [Pythium insidiosum]